MGSPAESRSRAHTSPSCPTTSCDCTLVPSADFRCASPAAAGTYESAIAPSCSHWPTSSSAANTRTSSPAIPASSSTWAPTSAPRRCTSTRVFLTRGSTRSNRTPTLLGAFAATSASFPASRSWSVRSVGGRAGFSSSSPRAARLHDWGPGLTPPTSKSTCTPSTISWIGSGSTTSMCSGSTSRAPSSSSSSTPRDSATSTRW